MPNAEYCSRRLAAFVLGKNERTIKRWSDEGNLDAGPADDFGRSTVGLSAVLSLLGELPDPDLAELILDADKGDAAAQCDLGMVLLQMGHSEGAFELFQESTRQDYPEAMHWLYQCHMKGLGVEKDERLAMMWLHKAAAHGHVIAKAQADAISALALQQLQASGPPPVPQ